MLNNSWIEIDLDKVIHNLNQVKEFVGHTKILGVVKANAYGIGAVETARVLEKADTDMLGVTTLSEGIRLREAGIALPILVFSPLLEEQMERALQADLTITISFPEHVFQLGSAADYVGKAANVHIKVETGMGRTGISPKEVINVVEKIIAHDKINLEGIYTHFPKATVKKTTEKQFELFNNTVENVKRLGCEQLLAHCCNSAAALLYPEMHGDMVRVGTLLYGQYPLGVLKTIDIKDPWSAKAKIIYLRRMPKGTGVGYGHEYVTKRDTYIGIIPLGFTDGFGVMPLTRAKSLTDMAKMLLKTVLGYFGWSENQLKVHAGNYSYPVVGRIGMQLTMIDLGDKPHINVGDEVSIFLRRTMADNQLERRYSFKGSKVIGTD